MLTHGDRITPPILIFQDDGAHVYESIIVAEQSHESIDVHQSPSFFGYGYDSFAQGVRLSVKEIKREIAFGFKVHDTGVILKLAPEVLLDNDPNARDSILKYIGHMHPAIEAKYLAKLPIRELLKTALRK